ncbi:MAG: hypothetical protein U1F98_09635 [Verrucomicrobiota bacterium]
MNLTELSPADLRRAARIKEQIVRLTAELGRITGSSSGAPGAAPKRRKMSAAGRARIVAAQKLRWAKIRAGKK